MVGPKVSFAGRFHCRELKLIPWVLLSALEVSREIRLKIGVFQALKEQSIRCSIVGLAAEVRLCKNICQATQGLSMSNNNSPPPTLGASISG